MHTDSETDAGEIRAPKRVKITHGLVANDDHPQPGPPPRTSSPLSSPVDKTDSPALQATATSDPPASRKKQPLSCGECRRYERQVMPL